MKLLLTSCDFTLSSSFCSALSPAGPLLLYPSAERAELSQCWGPGSASPLRHHPGELRTRAPSFVSRRLVTRAAHSGRDRTQIRTDTQALRTGSSVCLRHTGKATQEMRSRGGSPARGWLLEGPVSSPAASLTFLFHGPGGGAVCVRTWFRRLLRISRVLFLQGG